MPNMFTVGSQPCNSYRPREADLMIEAGHGIANSHDCYGGCLDSQVSFCSNCHFDHHAHGWNTCPQTWNTK